MLTLAGSTPGGAQVPITLLGHMIPITIYGVLALSIITIPFFKPWVKQFGMLTSLEFLWEECLYLKTWNK